MPERPSLHRVVERLAAAGCKPRWLGEDRVRSLCPGHRDTRPSLCLDWRAGRVLVKDFGGCPTAIVLRALGVSPRDLFDEPRKSDGAITNPPSTRTIAIYPYADVLGSIYARKVRGETKVFTWQRPTPDSSSSWRRGLAGLRPGLFGVDWLIDERRVFAVEGEKAVLFLRERRIPAVCPPAGANCWRPAWTQALWRLGCLELIILPDADEPGRAHAARVAAACSGFRPALPEGPLAGDPWDDVLLQPDDSEATPLTVKIAALPGLGHGEDAVDWLTTHAHSITDLALLADAAPVWQAVDLAARHRELTRQRVARYRQRHRASLSPCNAREIEHAPPQRDFPIEISHSVTGGRCVTGRQA